MNKFYVQAEVTLLAVSCTVVHKKKMFLSYTPSEVSCTLENSMKIVMDILFYLCNISHTFLTTLNKLRAVRSQGMLRIIHCRIFNLPVSFKNNLKVKLQISERNDSCLAWIICG